MSQISRFWRNSLLKNCGHEFFFYYYYVRLKGSFCYFQIPWIIFLFTNVILSWPVFFFSIAMDNLIQFTKRVFRSSHKRQRCRDNKELKIVIVNKQLTGLRSMFVHPCGRICTKQHTVCSWLHTWQLPSFPSWSWHCCLFVTCVFVLQWHIPDICHFLYTSKIFGE